MTAIGSGEGGRPLVKILDETGALIRTFDAYDPNFRGGIDVDQGDVNGDSVPDIITAAGPGGVKAGDGVPHGTVNGDVPGGTFQFTVNGLSSYDWYKTGFYNAYQVYQQGQGLTEVLTQYDTGGVNGNSWPKQWPGEKFDVPLLLTELGKSRAQLNQSQPAQFDWIANQQARVVERYLSTNPTTNIMGYAIFEWNDESDKKGPLGALDATFGVNLLVSPQYPVNGNILFSSNTGTTPLPDGRPAFANFSLPVFELFPVKNNNGTALLSELKAIFNQ